SPYLNNLAHISLPSLPTRRSSDLLGDQVALDLREQADQRDGHLGLKVLLTLQADRLLDGDQADPFVEELIDGLNVLPQAAAQPRSEEHTLNSSHQISSYAVFCLRN